MLWVDVVADDLGVVTVVEGVGGEVVWLLGDGVATDGVVVFDELVGEDALTGVGDTIGVGVVVVVLTGVGLAGLLGLVQAEVGPLG